LEGVGEILDLLSYGDSCNRDSNDISLAWLRIFVRGFLPMWVMQVSLVNSTP